MRFIIREQDYEKLVAAGRLKYRSGAFENWRLTEAVDSYLVMRVDLDQRDTGIACSTLLHVLLDPDGRLQRAKLRDFMPQGSLSVDVLMDGDSFTVSRIDTHGAFHDQVDSMPGSGLLLPGLVGLALFVRNAGPAQDHATIILDPGQHYAPKKTFVSISALEEKKLAVTSQTVAVRPYLIQHNNLRLTIMLDQYGVPVRVDDEEGLLALEDRYVRHR